MTVYRVYDFYIEELDVTSFEKCFVILPYKISDRKGSYEFHKKTYVLI